MRNWIDIVEATNGRTLAALKKAFANRDMSNFQTVKNQWLVHLTSIEHAHQIAQSGFTRGSPVESDLALTWGSNYDAPGINFAYLADDEMSIMTISERQSISANNAIVMFRGDGLLMTHYDEFDQVAFWGQNVKSSFYVIGAMHDDEDHDDYDGHEEPHDRKWQLFTPINGKRMAGELFTLMNWVEQNAP